MADLRQLFSVFALIQNRMDSKIAIEQKEWVGKENLVSEKTTLAQTKDF